MNHQNELNRVRQNLNNWLAAFNNKDIDALLSLYDPDSIYANAAAPMMRGLEEIKPWYQSAFEMISGTLLYKEEQHFIAGDIAMLLGAYYFKPPADEAPPEGMTLTGRVALTYRRNAENDWKLLFDMDNTPPDVTPEMFS